MTVMRQPQPPSAVAQVPHGRTARRIDWLLLPPPLRRTVEARLGTRVAHAESAGAGYTPGFASLLVGEDGSRTFVKAASKVAQRPFADAYREEARNLGRLPTGLPVPRLLWSLEDDLWVVLALAHVEGENPVRPWDGRELEACLDTLEVLADSLTPAPRSLGLRPLTHPEELGGMLAGWSYVRRQLPDWPHLAEAAELAGRDRLLLTGNSLVHTDARDDNFVLGRDGAVLCDWNFPVLGPVWADTVMLLISAFGDGLDADALLARRRLTRDVDPERVDVLLALLAGHFLRGRDQPTPSSSPFLRVHQEWYAQASWGWLAQRRGWE